MEGWVLEGILDLAKKINHLHKTFGEEWITEESVNLKTKRIEHICFEESFIDSSFYNYAMKYIQKVARFSVENVYSIDSPYRLVSRTKSPDSIVAKIMYYRHEKSERGRVSINKCLNDLLGLRIFVSGFAHEENTKKLGEMLAKYSIKVHNSCKGEYRATHLYFQNKNNRLFPWELQIWNQEDEEKNLASHAVHKQDYTTWPLTHVRSKISGI